MKPRKSVVAVVSPLILAMAILTVMGMVSTRNLVFLLNELAKSNIPLTSQVSRVTEHQLERALWFERAVFFAEAGRERDLARAMEEAAKLDRAVAQELAAGIELARLSWQNSRTPASRQHFGSVLNVLESLLEERARYQQSAQQLLEKLRAEGPMPTGESLFAAVQAQEDRLNEKLENARLQLSRFAEQSSEEALRIERLVMVFMIVGASMLLLLGIIAFPLVLLFWE